MLLYKDEVYQIVGAAKVNWNGEDTFLHKKVATKSTKNHKEKRT